MQDNSTEEYGLAQRSRIQNVSNNFIWTAANSLVSTIFPFIVRSLLIRYIGIEYSGVSSLFTSVFQVLSVAELGIGNAVVFYLYRSVGQWDVPQTRYFLRMLRRIYRIIGAIITAAGVILFPFVPYLVKGKEYPNGLNLYVIFAIYIINAAFAYLTAGYRTILLQADQRADVVEKAGVCAGASMYVLQIGAILLTGNYYIYCGLLLISPVFNTVLPAIAAGRLYPEIFEKEEKEESYQPEPGFRKDFMTRIISIALAKIRNISRNSFDSIVISAFLGLSVLAMYQNYYQIMLVPITMLGMLHRAVGPSLGNSVAMENQTSNYQVLRIYSFIQQGAVAICLSCLLNLYQPFMRLWVGEDYLLPYEMVILFCIYFYLMSLSDIGELLKETTGVWSQERVLAVVEASANLVLNLILVAFWGVAGVVLATIITLACINLPFEFLTLFRRYFNQNGLDYFRIQLKYALTTILACGCSCLLCHKIPETGILWFGVRLLVSVCIPGMILLFIYRKSKEMRWMQSIMSVILQPLQNRLGRRGGKDG